MNNTKTILILIAAAISYWWFLSGERSTQQTPSKITQPAPSQQSSEHIPPSAPPRANPTLPAAPSLPTTTKPVAPPSDPHSAPPHSVPFELNHGLVVTQGDILIGKPTSEDFPQSGFIQEPKLQLWSGNQIPFSIDPQLPNPERVLRSIQYFNEHSPVQFVPYNGEPDSIVFAPGQELCLSYLGKIGGAQPIYLDDRCGEHEIRHEIMHALGFIHEQSRPDRDRFVQVNWDNIEDQKQSQFFIISENLNNPIRERPFDYNSVMLYSTSSFAKDRSKPTMVSRTEKPIEPSQNSLSQEDLERLRLLYSR